MELDRIKILIDRYFDGITSREDEHELARYFSECNDIPEEYQVVKMMFTSFNTIANDAPTSDIRLPDKMVRHNTITISRRWYGGIAAAITLVIGIVAIFSHEYNNSAAQSSEPSYVCYVNGIKVEDDMLAYAEAYRILGSVSENVQIVMAEIDRITHYTIAK